MFAGRRRGTRPRANSAPRAAIGHGRAGAGAYSTDTVPERG